MKKCNANSQLFGSCGTSRDAPLEVRQPEKGLVEKVVGGELKERAVEADEDGDLDEAGEAAREGVHVVGTVQSAHLTLHHFRVRLVPRLNRLDLRRIRVKRGEAAVKHTSSPWRGVYGVKYPHRNPTVGTRLNG